MTTTYGLTPAGFVPKTLLNVQAELQADYRATWGTTLDLGSATNMGQEIGIISERLSELWDALQAIYSSQNPDAATGTQLDVIGALTGTIRDIPRKSVVTVTATGTPSSTLLSGRIFSTAGAGIRFQTTADATLASVPAWAALHTYAAGDRVTNNSNVYRCTTGGVSAASGGPTTTASAITDGSAVWRFLGAGTGAVDVAASSVDYGALPAFAYTLTSIETPVAGLSNVTNLADATLGNSVETDAAYRVRRQGDLHSSGNAAVEAIRTQVREVDGVTAVVVFNNDTAFTNGDGMPPKSVEAVVQGGADAAVRAAVFAAVGGGIQAYGTNSGTVVDSEGNSHTVAFTRPTLVQVYVAIAVEVTSAYPTTGDAQVQQALATYGALAYLMGDNPTPSQLASAAFTVPGVKNVLSLAIGPSVMAEASATMVISSRQQAVVTSSNVAVTSTPWSP